MRRKTARESPFVLSGSCSSVRRTPDPQCPWNCLCWARSLLQRHGRWRADAKMLIALLAYKGFGSSKRVADAQLQMGHLCHHSKAQRTSWKKRQKEYEDQRKQGRVMKSWGLGMTRLLCSWTHLSSNYLHKLPARLSLSPNCHGWLRASWPHLSFIRNLRLTVDEETRETFSSIIHG